MRGALKMQPHTTKIDEKGRLLIASEFQRKLGISLDASPKVTLTKLGDTLVVQKAEEGCQLPNTKKLDNLSRVELDKELLDSMGWNTKSHVGINNDIITIKSLTPEQLQKAIQKEQQRKAEQEKSAQQHEVMICE